MTPNACKVAFSSVVFLAFSAAAWAQDWPQWRGPERTGAVSGGVKLINAIPPGGLTVLWKSEPIRDTGSPSGEGSDVGYSSPVAGGGRVYLYLNQRTKDESPLRLPWGVRNRLGCFDSPMPEDLARQVETARNSTERAALASDAVAAWASEWVARNLTHAQYVTFGARIEDRLTRGAAALDLQVLDKLTALRGQTFATEDDLDEALTQTGLKSAKVSAVIDELTENRVWALDIIYCLDAATGKTLWKKTYPGELFEYGTSSTPCLVGDKIYFSGGKTIYCLRARDGSEIWQVPCPAKEVSSSPLVADDVLLMQAGSLCALDTKDGKLLWARPEFKGVHPSPTLWRKDGKTYVVPNNGLVELRTGQLMWCIDKDHTVDSSPVVSDDRVVFAFMGGLVCYRLATDKPQELWKLTGHHVVPSTPAIFQGHLYAVKSQSGPLFCVDMATGTVKWRSPEKENYGVGAINTASCIVVDGKVLIDSGAATKTGNDFYIVRAQPKQFELLGKGSVALSNHRASTAVVADGRLFIRGRDALVCYDLRAK